MKRSRPRSGTRFPVNLKGLIRSIFWISLLLAALCLLMYGVTQIFIQSTDTQVTRLLNSLTLDEKIGQMIQMKLSSLVSLTQNTVEHANAAFVIHTYEIGSVVGSWGVQAHSAESWSTVEHDFNSHVHRTRSKIPLLLAVESLHGANFVQNAAIFPHNIGIAATFNVTLAKLAAQVTAYEMRAAQVRWNLAPSIDLGFDSRWARIWETFGEDPYVVRTLGVATIEGLQGRTKNAISPEKVLATVGHFIAYGDTVSGKVDSPSIISHNDMLEYHIPAFQKAIESGVAAVRIGSVLINGVPVMSDPNWLTNILKNEMAFDGVAIADWTDVIGLVQRARIAESLKDAIAMVINAGVDLLSGVEDLSVCGMIHELVHDQVIAVSRIDDAVKRILKMKVRAGLFSWQSASQYPDLGSEKHRKIAKEATLESITLLKNTGRVLPLTADRKILVVGPNAHSMRSLNGGWTGTIQGLSGHENSGQYKTILQAIQEANGQTNVLFAEPVSYNDAGQWWEERSNGFAEAIEKAKRCHYILLVLGENAYAKKSGDLDDLFLSDNQIELANAMFDTGRPVILILNSGRPRLLGALVNRSAAILDVYLPGNYGGEALADILFGKVNPSGKLPYTYPRFRHTLIPYWHKHSEEATKQPQAADNPTSFVPEWEFGFGLSYTSFNYSDLEISPQKLIEKDEFTVSVMVTNLGKAYGKETVLLFTSDLYASLSPAVKRLRRFTKIELVGGQSEMVTFVLNTDDLSFVNAAGKHVTEPGVFNICIANLCTKVLLEKRTN